MTHDTTHKIWVPLISILGFVFLVNPLNVHAEVVASQIFWNTTMACASDGNTGETYRIRMNPLLSDNYVQSVTFYTNSSSTVSLFVNLDTGTSTPASEYATITPATAYVVFHFNPPRYIAAGSQWYLYPPYSTTRTMQYGTTATTSYSVTDDWAGAGVPCNGLTVVPAFSVSSEFVETPPLSPSTLTFSCGSLDFSCYAKEAIAWAFLPSEGVFDKFVTLKDDIKDHAPFGYFTSAATAIGSFSTTTATSTTLAIPGSLKTFVFNPMRDALTVIVGAASLIWLYKRLSDINV